MDGNEVDCSASENPFRASRIKPGAISYVFPGAENVELLVDRLRQTGWWGEIIGPHGTGKSTLLETLIPALDSAGHPTVRVALHDGQRRLPLDWSSNWHLRAPMILVIDGYEQLSYWNRWIAKRFCRRHGLGLLVTAHRSVGFPRLYQTVVPPDLAQQVVDRLLDGRPPPFTSEEVSTCLAKHGGDLRETLFDLYDIYHQRRPSSGQNVN